ncbi:MAG: tetratricopeptide repeat protein, partial [Burkholderiales bacterium]
MLNSRLLPILFLMLAGSAHAGDYEIASNMQKAGAEELALAFMQEHPPVKPDSRWNSLEINLLSKTGKNDQVLDLAKQLPFSRENVLLAVKSAFALGKPALARDWLVQLIWKENLSRIELRQARLQVIESLIMEKDGKSAYYAMLRFDQDYHPVSIAEADEFVGGLFSMGMTQNTAPWLVLLDDGDPVKIRAELEAGLIDPGVAIKSAKGDIGILLAASKMKTDPSAEISALETLLAAGRISPEALWKSYQDHAIEFSNHYALLQGSSWFGPIAKITDPYAARSLLAYLADHEKDAKDKAISLIIDSLEGEPKVALSLFSNSPDLSSQAKHALGKVAFGSGDYASCVKFWDGLALKKSEPLDLAHAWLKTGQPEKAAAVLGEYLKGVKTLDPQVSNRILPLLEKMVAMEAPASKDLLESLLPLADGNTKREALMLLGQASDNPKQAAAYYFEAAIGKKDDLAKKARMLCI